MSANADLPMRVDAALREEEPDSALHAVARALLAEGHTQVELLDALSDYRGKLAPNRDTDDELILDIMAVLDGYASATAVRNLMAPRCVTPHAWNGG